MLVLWKFDATLSMLRILDAAGQVQSLFIFSSPQGTLVRFLYRVPVIGCYLIVGIHVPVVT